MTDLLVVILFFDDLTNHFLQRIGRQEIRFDEGFFPIVGKRALHGNGKVDVVAGKYLVPDYKAVQVWTLGDESDVRRHDDVHQGKSGNVFLVFLDEIFQMVDVELFFKKIL